MDTASHTPRVSTHPDPACWGFYQPHCSCGWTGEISPHEGDASAEAVAHAAASNDRTVDTARERALEIIRRYAPTATETPLERAQRDA